MKKITDILKTITDSKVYAFLFLCVYVLNTIGSTCYLFYYHKALFAVTNLLIAAALVPEVIRLFKNLIN